MSQVPVIIEIQKLKPWARLIDLYPIPKAIYLKDKKVVITMFTWNQFDSTNVRFLAPEE